MATMMSGKTIASAISLVTMPIIARLYLPSDFGVAAAFLSIVGIASNVATLSYGTAIVLPKDDREARTLVSLAYRVLFVYCALMTMVLVIYKAIGGSWTVLELLADWIWYLPLGVLLMAATSIQEGRLTRSTQFSRISASLVLGTVVNSTTRILSAILAGTTVFGLILSNLLGMLTRLLFQRSAKTGSKNVVSSAADIGSLRRTAFKYRDFPLFNVPASFIFAIGQNLPVLLFGIMFSPATAGYYAMANRLSRAPVTVVARSVRRVFMQKASAIRNRGGSLRKAYFLTTAVLLALGVLPFGALFFFGTEILGFLLGDRWISAGKFLEIMAPWLLMAWVTAPANSVFVVLQRQRLWLVVQVVTTVFRLGSFGLAMLLSWKVEQTLWAFVIATVAANVVTILITLIQIDAHAKMIET